jgi:hypothetical protein
MKLVTGVSPEEAETARLWWKDLPEAYKAQCSIWTLLAMYAKRRDEARGILTEEAETGEP